MGKLIGHGKDLGSHIGFSQSVKSLSNLTCTTMSMEAIITDQSLMLSRAKEKVSRVKRLNWFGIKIHK